MPLSKQMERLLCSFFGRFPVSEFVHKKTPDGGFETGGTEGISGVRFVTFAYFAVAQTLINKLSPHHKKTPHQGSFFMARPRRFERLTHSLEGCCSIQLS